MGSELASDPARFADHEWLAAPYTQDGRTVYSLVHNEYQGDKYPGQCPSGEYLECWYNAVTLAVSRDGGRTYRHVAAPPAHRVASLPYVYEPDSGPYGYFAPSNIVLNRKDGYHYAMLRAADVSQSALWHVPDADQDPGGPRLLARLGWCRFRRSIRRPLHGPQPRSRATTSARRCRRTRSAECRRVSPTTTYFDKWLLVGSSQDTIRGREVFGFFYSLSDDLRSWSHRKLIREVEMTWSFECGDSNPVSYPSVLDPRSPSRNFETSGRNPDLYFTRMHYSNCQQGLNRDLVRVPIRFSK